MRLSLRTLTKHRSPILSAVDKLGLRKTAVGKVAVSIDVPSLASNAVRNEGKHHTIGTAAESPVGKVVVGVVALAADALGCSGACTAAAAIAYKRNDAVQNRKLANDALRANNAEGAKAFTLAADQQERETAGKIPPKVIAVAVGVILAALAYRAFK